MRRPEQLGKSQIRIYAMGRPATGRPAIGRPAIGRPIIIGGSYIGPYHTDDYYLRNNPKRASYRETCQRGDLSCSGLP
jgi:hypothetical protein